MQQGIWLLYLSSKNNLGLIPCDLNYFQTHFVGRPMIANWQPPPLTISGKSKRLADFLSWMHNVPVCSEKAKLCLESVIGSYVEFLPLIEVRQTFYYAINVLRLIDWLDLDNSTIVYSSSDHGSILNIESYAFISGTVGDAPIFRTPYPTSNVFVTSSHPTGAGLMMKETFAREL